MKIVKNCWNCKKIFYANSEDKLVLEHGVSLSAPCPHCNHSNFLLSIAIAIPNPSIVVQRHLNKGQVEK